MILKMTDSKQLLQTYFEKYCSGENSQEKTSFELTVSILNSIVGCNRFREDESDYNIYENDTIIFSSSEFLLSDNWYDELIALIEKTILITKLEIIVK